MGNAQTKGEILKDHHHTSFPSFPFFRTSQWPEILSKLYGLELLHAAFENLSSLNNKLVIVCGEQHLDKISRPKESIPPT